MKRLEKQDKTTKKIKFWFLIRDHIESKVIWSIVIRFSSSSFWVKRSSIKNQCMYDWLSKFVLRVVHNNGPYVVWFFWTRMCSISFLVNHMIETLNDNDDDLSSIVFVKDEEESNTFKYRNDWISIQGRLSVLLLCIEMNVPDMKNGDDDDKMS